MYVEVVYEASPAPIVTLLNPKAVQDVRPCEATVDGAPCSEVVLKGSSLLVAGEWVDALRCIHRVANGQPGRLEGVGEPPHYAEGFRAT
jgi:hypothetical protein